MNVTQARKSALALLGETAWIERYPARKTKVFGETHVAVAQFAVGRTNRIGGREVFGRGLSWEEALDHASERIAP